MEVSLYICYEFTVAQKCSRLSKSNMHDFWARKKFLMHYILIEVKFYFSMKHKPYSLLTIFTPVVLHRG